jgi:hypothetical protein
MILKVGSCYFLQFPLNKKDSMNNGSMAACAMQVSKTIDSTVCVVIKQDDMFTSTENGNSFDGQNISGFIERDPGIQRENSVSFGEEGARNRIDISPSRYPIDTKPSSPGFSVTPNYINNNEMSSDVRLFGNDEVVCVNKAAFPCNDCGKTFASYQQLVVHQTIHDVVKCEVCGMKFTHRSSKYRHMLLHTGTKKHECKVCPRKFARRDHFVQHMATHFENLNSKLELSSRPYPRAWPTGYNTH